MRQRRTLTLSPEVDIRAAIAAPAGTGASVNFSRANDYG